MSDALTQKLERALADLGDTPEAVAAYLEGQGVRGIREDPAQCPVAKYLTQTFACPALVAFRTKLLNLDNMDVPTASIRTPATVKEFTERFDAGHYPQLEAR